MLDQPRIIQAVAQPTAVIHLVVPRGEIQNVMGPGIGEVRAVIAAQGVAPAGPWFAHHLRMTPGLFDFEVGVPVSSPVVAEGRVKPGLRPASEVARTVHHGAYEGLHAAWGELGAWIAAQGYTPAGDLWECYLVGPESSPNPADWRTELNRPLVG